MPTFTPQDQALAARLPELLLPWYQREKREMPWRGPKDSYYTWVSEIMLQQTRVEAVRGYFDRFIAALPTLPHLAACPEDTLLKLWEGLGYYNRARNMQKAARLVMERYGGRLPADYRELLALPGIGEYTAGAIASIAYGIPVPCVDGNVQRVMSRITAHGENILLPKVKREYQELLQAVIPADCPGDFNQSLMELGAIVCLPGGAPLCGRCPAAGICRAHQAGRELDYPVKPQKAARRVEQRTICLVFSGGKLLLFQRPPKGLLAGMGEVCNWEGERSKEEVRQELIRMGLAPQSLRTLKKAKHIFCHVEWRMSGYLARVEEPVPAGGGVWAEVPQVREEYALPSALSAYSEELERWQAL